MPQTLALPILAILLPGVLACWLGRKVGRIWPGILLTCAAVGCGGRLVHQSAGDAADDAAAAPRIMTAFTFAAPAAMSALVGMAFARASRTRAG